VVSLTDVAVQLRVATAVLSAVSTVPWVLVYPGLGAACMVGLPVVGTALLVAFTPHPVVLVATWAGIVVVIPVAFSFAMVAYCHELDAAFRGRRLPPGTGARVALRRAKRVTIAGFVVGTGGFVVHSTAESVPFGERLGLPSKWALRVAGVFAFPAVATTDAPIRETFGDVLAATESAWGGAAVTTLSTQALGTVIAWTGIVPAVVLLLGGFAGIVPYVGPLGPLTLPLLVGVGGLVTAIGTQFAVDGVLRAALYRYAHDGRLPSALAAEPGRFVETAEAGNGRNGEATGPT
jgi:hypothetical protein